MKRMVFSVLAVLSLAGVAGLSAQEGVRIGIGGGAQLPTGDYGKVDKMGWLIGGDVTYWLTGSPIGIRGDVQYAQTSHKNNVDGNSKVIGGLAEVVYAFGTSAEQLRPYIFGGVGYYNVKVTIPSLSFDQSESKVGFGGGAGDVGDRGHAASVAHGRDSGRACALRSFEAHRGEPRAERRQCAVEHEREQ